MNEKQNNDLRFLENEILGEIKNVENKIDTKILKISQSLEKQNTYYEQKINNLENILNILKEKIQSINTENINEIDTTKINALNKKIEDTYLQLDSKITLLRIDLKDISYKFEKTINLNLQVPGMIGERCPYSNMRDFLENMNKKINEALRNKEFYNIEFKKQREKVESIISQNKNYIPMFETKIIEYIDSQLKDVEDKYKEKSDIINEEIINIRNGKENKIPELINKYNELNEKYIKINEIVNNTLAQYNEELNKYRNSFNDVNEKLKNFDEQYHIFCEKINLMNGLNDSIKQIKSMYNNIKNDNNNNSNNKNENNYEENNTNYINNNFLDYNIQNEEMEIISLINSKQNENKEDSTLNKLTQNEKKEKVIIGEKKNKNKKNYCNLINKYNKKRINSNFFDESSEYTKINNIIFDAEFFKRSN